MGHGALSRLLGSRPLLRMGQLMLHVVCSFGMLWGVLAGLARACHAAQHVALLRLRLPLAKSQSVSQVSIVYPMIPVAQGEAPPSACIALAVVWPGLY